MLHAPISTLFPYTTLFRSSLAVENRKIWDDIRKFGIHPYEAPQGTPYKDRKSTRLNSSHANISYAVFCLKKKTTPINDVNSGCLGSWPAASESPGTSRSAS